MRQFPERINNYCEVNRLSADNFFGVGALSNGEIEEVGHFVSANKLAVNPAMNLSAFLPIALPILADHFLPNRTLRKNLVAHLHLLIDGDRFWLFASPNELDKKTNSTHCNPECEQIKLSKQQLHDLLKQQDQFINLISHDFRSPLSTLIEGVDIVHANLKAKYELNEFDEAIMEQLREELIQLLNYTNKLHDWTKLDTKADPAMYEDFLLDQVISSAVISFSDSIKEKEVQLERDYRPDLKYITDRRLFSLVIHHLIDNSIKFSTNNCKINITATGEYFQIKDNGEGINPEKLELIKKGYLTKNRKLYGKGIGPGLGLNIVTRILRSLNYTYDIQSEVGIGTCFTIKMK